MPAASPVRPPPPLPPLFSVKVPLRTSSVPVLLNGNPIVVVPVPIVFLNVPLLENVDGDPPNALPIDSSFSASQVPLLLIVAPEPVRIPAAPVQVAVPALFSVRTVMSLKFVPLIFSVP